jgi:hypothetical protein
MTRKLYSPSAGKWYEVVSVETPSAPAKRKRSVGSHFTMFPKIWREQLRKVKARGTTYEVAMVILDKARFAEWVTLSNVGLAKLGVNRHAKYDAIKELKDAALIIVEGRGRCSPRIKALYTGQPSVA